MKFYSLSAHFSHSTVKVLDNVPENKSAFHTIHTHLTIAILHSPVDIRHQLVLAVADMISCLLEHKGDVKVLWYVHIPFDCMYHIVAPVSAVQLLKKNTAIMIHCNIHVPQPFEDDEDVPKLHNQILQIVWQAPDHCLLHEQIDHFHIHWSPQ